MNCVVCGTVMDPVLAPATTHPSCIMFAEPGNEDRFTVTLREKLTEIISWAQDNEPRSLQVAIGPSEMGEQCDRQVAYRVAGIPSTRRQDKWPATVGTATHTWLQGAVNRYAAHHRDNGWATELTLSIVDGIEGHSDLYWEKHRAVIDWKTKGPDALRKIRKEGPLPGEVIQAHIYGYGFMKAGIPVEHVVLAYLSRAGWLKDMYVWHAPYDPSIAENALSRVFGIAQQILDLDILKKGHSWEPIPATPGNACGMCPWYDPNRSAGADDTGCPGR